MRNRFSALLGALVALSLVMGACSTGQDSRNAAAGAAREVAAMRVPMTEAVTALADLVARGEAGDAKGRAEAYQRFALAFGKVLGPVSLRDVNTAQKMANANTALQEMLAQKSPDVKAVAREAAVIMHGLNQAAASIGTSLVARADAEMSLLGAADQGRIIEVKATDYGFSPIRIEVSRGERVTIRLINLGKEWHEWEVEGLDLEIEKTAPGTWSELTFTPHRTGTFDIMCDMEDHADQGMRGKLIVR